MNKTQAYARALALVNNRFGAESNLTPTEMTVEYASDVFHFLMNANFLEVIGIKPDANGIYTEGSISEDDHKVYAQLVTVMWECQVRAKLKHETPFDFAPTGRRFSYLETLKNGIHRLYVEQKGHQPMAGQVLSEFAYYTGKN